MRPDLTQSDTDFADVFPATDESTWRKSVDAVLKGKPFQTLISSTADDIAIQPLYAAGSGPRPLRAQSGDWAVVSRIDHPDHEAANAQMLEDLQGGAAGIHLVFEGSVSAHHLGISWRTSAKMRPLLANVQFQTGVRLALDLGLQSRGAAIAIAQHIAEEGVAPNLVHVDFGLDPLGLIAQRGGGEDWNATASDFAALATQLVEFGFGGSAVSCDGGVIGAAGGSEAQELAFVLACGVAYLRALNAGGLSLMQARKLLSFRLAANADVLVGVAKFRALRLLWARVEAACGLEPKPIDMFAQSSWTMMTKQDPWVNVLRGGAAAFAAALGGADAICLLPLTQAIGLPDAFSRRLARNTQLILLQEAHLGQVEDAAGGAGAFEALTAELCAKAWALFQDIEARGGIYVALRSGHFQAKVAAVREAKLTDLKSGQAKLIGVTHFQNAHESPVDVLMPLPSPKNVHAPDFPALTPIRLAEGFE